jgi:hypothetical protein
VVAFIARSVQANARGRGGAVQVGAAARATDERRRAGGGGGGGAPPPPPGPVEESRPRSDPRRR